MQGGTDNGQLAGLALAYLVGRVVPIRVMLSPFTAFLGGSRRRSRGKAVKPYREQRVRSKRID